MWSIVNFYYIPPGSKEGGNFDKMIPFFHCRVKRGKILAAHIFVHATKRFLSGNSFLFNSRGRFLREPIFRVLPFR